MRKAFATSLIFLVFAACSSTGSNGRSGGPSIKPEIQITQTSETPLVARHQQGTMNVQFAVGVANRSNENITLKRVNVVSLSEGAYHVNHSMSYNVGIAPDQFQQVDFWAPARTGMSLVGQAGPVTVRVTCEFDSASGKFQTIVTRVVSENDAVSD